MKIYSILLWLCVGYSMNSIAQIQIDTIYHRISHDSLTLTIETEYIDRYVGFAGNFGTKGILNQKLCFYVYDSLTRCVSLPIFKQIMPFTSYHQSFDFIEAPISSIDINLYQGNLYYKIGCVAEIMNLGTTPTVYFIYSSSGKELYMEYIKEHGTYSRYTFSDTEFEITRFHSETQISLYVKY